MQLYVHIAGGPAYSVVLARTMGVVAGWGSRVDVTPSYTISSVFSYAASTTTILRLLLQLLLLLLRLLPLLLILRLLLPLPPMPRYVLVRYGVRLSASVSRRRAVSIEFDVYAVHAERPPGFRSALTSLRPAEKGERARACVW